MSNNAVFIPESCPYLGLHDDPRTSLAYPSVWNYCYRANPPASVIPSHQVTTCLKREYVNCPVYLAEVGQLLPSGLRGRLKVPARRVRGKTRKSNHAVWIVLLAALLILTVWLGTRFLPKSPPLSTPSLVATSTEIPTSTARAGWTNPAQIVTINATTPTHRPSQTPQKTVLPALPTLTLFPMLIPGTCGHALDIPFGTGPQFVIHRVAGGENLELFALKYQTTQEAIRALNFSLPVPVWSDWIIVIPIGTSDMRGIPSFELYQASGQAMTLDELARQLGADALSMQKYNAFDDTCRTFVNWLLVPRVRLDD